MSGLFGVLRSVVKLIGQPSPRIEIPNIQREGLSREIVRSTRGHDSSPQPQATEPIVVELG